MLCLNEYITLSCCITQRNGSYKKSFFPVGLMYLFIFIILLREFSFLIVQTIDVGMLPCIQRCWK